MRRRRRPSVRHSRCFALHSNGQTLLPLRFQPTIRRLARICTPMKVETAPLVLCRARIHLRPTGRSRVRCKIRRFKARTRTASSSERLRSLAGISAARGFGVPATMHCAKWNPELIQAKDHREQLQMEDWHDTYSTVPKLIPRLRRQGLLFRGAYRQAK